MKDNILFVCPTEGWSVRERTAFKDILTAKERGNNVFLFALKDSYIDLKASEFNIPVIHFFGKLSTKVLKWRKLKNISNEIKKNKINIVHCYNVEIIWPITFFLRKYPFITCILSTFTNIKENYKRFLHKTLSKRIDFILNYNQVHENNIVESLGVPAIKIHTEYLPVNIESSSKLTKVKLLKKMGIETEEEVFLFGTHIDVNTKDISNIIPLLNALSIFVSKNQNDCRLILFSEKNWGNSLIYPELIKYMKASGIEDNIVFYRSGSQINPPKKKESELSHLLYIEEIQPVLDIWINVESEDTLDDLMVSSVLGGTPVLGVRVSSLKEFLTRFQGVGATYSYNDSREIRVKIETILENHKKYKQKIKRLSQELEANTGFDKYSQRINDIYQGALRKRKRFFNKKK